MSISGQTYANLASNVIGKIDEFIGEHELSEDIVSTILRLTGFTNAVNQTDPKETFVLSFAQKKDKVSLNSKEMFKNYLEGLKARIKKWQKDTSVTRINKINRLIGENQDVPDAGITIDDSLDAAVQKIAKFQKKLSDEQDVVGLLNAQSAAYQAASDKVDALVAALPTNQFGNFGSEVVALLKADNGFLTTTSSRLNRRISALKVELNKLQKQEQYILTGVTLQNAEGTISLMKIVEIMLYLVEKVEYKCKECIYFNGSQCLYGANNLDATPDNSCLEIYKKEDNPFWKVSNETVKKVKDFAGKL